MDIPYVHTQKTRISSEEHGVFIFLLPSYWRIFLISGVCAEGSANAKL